MKVTPKLGVLIAIAFIGFLLISMSHPEEKCQGLQCSLDTRPMNGPTTSTGLR